MALRDFLGFERNVIVQGTCHGADNRALVDALRSSAGRARGVATVSREVTDTQLAQLHDAGVRGVRFNFVKRLVDVTPHRRAAGDCATHRAARLARRGVLRGSGPAGARTLLRVAARRAWWSTTWAGPTCGSRWKAASSSASCASCRRTRTSGRRSVARSVCRVTGPPNYRDFVPFARRIVETFPDRVLWGTDWPHPNMKSHMPDDGDLVDLLPHIAPTSDLQRAPAGRQSDAPLLGVMKTYRRHSGHDGVRRRAVAQGLSPQHVLHVAHEGREPRALQGRRTRLSGRMADDRGSEAGGARSRLQPHARARRQHLLSREDLRHRRQAVFSTRRRS